MPSVNYKAYFRDQTRYINYFSFPQSVVDSIRQRYKLLFLKDYIFCSHQTEEFLSYLNSIIEIPNSSIFLYLAENNEVFTHLLDQLDSRADNFFNEFFAIYKSLTVDFLLRRTIQKYFLVLLSSSKAFT